MTDQRRQPADPRDQEQVVERSPGGANKSERLVDEHTAVSSTQSSGGLGGGSPAGGPRATPERRETERQIGTGRTGRDGRPDEGGGRENPVMPTDDQTLRTEI